MPDTPSAGRLLIVDDEVPLQQALCNTLQERGFEVVGFNDGASAMAALHTQRFDLLLSDLMMPEMDGITLMQGALRRDPQMVGIIMTGAGTISTAIAAMKNGAFDYILKPFKVSEILPVLHRALGMRQLRLDKQRLEQAVRERSAELEIANRDLSMFSSSVSHDLQAPIRIIGGYAEILLEDHASRLDEEGKQLLTTIQQQTVRMTDLIEGLLHLSGIGRQELSLAAVNMSELVQAVVGEQRLLHPERQAQIDVAPLPPCQGDAGLLTQVWANLIGNAVKYSAKVQAPRVRISAIELDGETVYEVADNGAGFDMQYASRLFTIFRRLHTANDFAGHGIGLSIVHRIIERHQGRIWADATPGKGATFRFTIGKPAPRPGTGSTTRR